MKTTTMILMVAGALAMQAVAADPNNGPSAFTKNQKESWTTAYKLWQPKKSAVSDKIDRVGGISSRPWAQIAGKPAPALFYDQRVHEPHFNLFWLGTTPD
jgi:hypothetical protein